MAKVDKRVRTQLIKETGTIEDRFCSRCEYSKTKYTSRNTKKNPFCEGCPTSDRLKYIGRVLEGKEHVPTPEQKAEAERILHTALQEKERALKQARKEYATLLQKHSGLLDEYNRLEKKAIEAQKRLIGAESDKGVIAEHNDVLREEVAMLNDTIVALKRDRDILRRQNYSALKDLDEAKTAVRFMKSL